MNYGWRFVTRGLYKTSKVLNLSCWSFISFSILLGRLEKLVLASHARDFIFMPREIQHSRWQGTRMVKQVHLAAHLWFLIKASHCINISHPLSSRLLFFLMRSTDLPARVSLFFQIWKGLYFGTCNSSLPSFFSPVYFILAGELSAIHTIPLGKINWIKKTKQE